MDAESIRDGAAGIGRSGIDLARRGYVLAKEKTMIYWALIPQKWQRGLIKFGLICGIVLFVWFGFAQHYKKVGAAGVLANSVEAGKEANATNENVRAAAAKPGAADRVRKKYCSDC